MSLFFLVWAGIKPKVKALIDRAMETLKDWVRPYVKTAIDALRRVHQTFTTVINNAYTTVNQFFSNVYNNVTKRIYQTITNVNKFVTNQITNVSNFITNVTGVDMAWVRQQLIDERSWLRNTLKLMDPMGFLTDPLGHIRAALDVQQQIAQATIVKSFWEGFEEGLAEEG